MNILNFTDLINNQNFNLINRLKTVIHLQVARRHLSVIAPGLTNSVYLIIKQKQVWKRKTK